MAQETWLMIAVGAGFLLLGIAASPLAWVALLHRRTMADGESARRFRELSELVRALRARVDRCEASVQGVRRRGGPGGGAPQADRAGRGPGVASNPATEGVQEPRLIAVPKLSAMPDRPAMHVGLAQRYAAIWELADSGASPDAIARATGQPIGQIELILGLRRQMGAVRPESIVSWPTYLTPKTWTPASVAPARPC